MPIQWLGIERVTHEEDRLREARYWASKTIQERLSAGWTLADHILFPENIDESEKRTGITLRRVPHSWR